MTFSEKHHECQQCRVQLHTSLILIILGLFLILLCCRLRSVCDLDAVHSPWNSYLWTSVTYSIIIQPRWPRQKCWSHHFCGLDSAQYCDCNSGRYCNKPATLSASIFMRSQIKTPYSKYSNIDDYKLWSLQWSIAKLLGFFFYTNWCSVFNTVGIWVITMKSTVDSILKKKIPSAQVKV